MNNHRRLLLMSAIIPALLLWGAGCPKAPQVEEVPEPPVERPAAVEKPVEPPRKEIVEDFPREKPVPPPVRQPTIAELNAQGVLGTVYFGFDRYDLTDETRGILRTNADWLRANGGYRALIEGHCDERGTIEYNLALGERRARAVRDYLTSLGISAPRLRIRSWGEERPVDPGHHESAWAKNRRAEFVIEP